jgi:ABC-type nitrate/sulfonate/bicarbonate transport system ATPase subunit
MIAPVLSLKNVGVSFATPTGEMREVLRDITYEIPDLPNRGEVRTVVGPSGCGKTTLLNCVAGLVQPTSGFVEACGAPVREPGPDRAFVFQSHNDLPWLTAEDNVALGLEFAGVPRSERRAVAREWLGRVGLEAAAERYPRQLSGGMRQRLALARALALKPRIILMDEPFGALDVRIRLDMQDLLRAVVAASQATVLLVTHDLNEAVYLGDEAVVMAPDPGRILATVDVPFGVDRPRSIEKTSAFRECVEHLTEQIRTVARAA